MKLLLGSVALATALLRAGSTQASPPAWPADVKYHADKTYHVAPGGNDQAGDGSLAAPFATLDQALHRIHSDRAGGNGPKLAEVAYRADGTYTQAQWIAESDLLIDSYSASPDSRGRLSEERATIQSDDVAIGLLHGHGLHLQNLRIVSVAGPTPGKYGFYANDTKDVTCDYCEFIGFNTNACFLGGSGFRFYHNYVARAWVPGVGRAQGLYTEGAANPDVQCNVFYHNGWNEKDFDINNAANVNLLMFNHGWYESHANGASAGTDRFNIYIDNATTGHQGRNGGVQEWNVYQSNGNASDSYVDDARGEIAHCAVFGNTHAKVQNDPAALPGPYWGGGLLGQSVNVSIHDCLFASDSTMQAPAAVTIAWPNDHGALPAGGTTAAVNNIRGIWPKPGVAVTDGRTASQSNVVIRPARAGEHVPSLMDYLGTQSDDQTAEKLRKHLHDSHNAAQAIITWLGRSLPGK
jgi:hypothetical protein